LILLLLSLPVFSYFDLGSSSYKTISSPPFTVNVVKGDDNRLHQNGNSQEVDLFTKPSSDDDLMSIDKGFFWLDLVFYYPDWNSIFFFSGGLF
jgi:hypothetical protein